MTVLSGIFLVSACLCILMLVVLSALDRRDESGVAEWMMANAVAFASFILYALGRQLPPLLAYEAANATYALATLVALAGFRRFSGRSVSITVYAVSLILFTVAIALFHYKYDSFALRTIAVSTFQAVALASIAGMVFQAKDAGHSRYPYLFTASAATIFALGNAVRAVVHVAQSGAVSSLLQPSPWSVFFISAGALVLPALTFGAMMMVHDRMLIHAANAASRDFLTGALTREIFLERLEREWARCRRTGRNLSMLMIEVDRTQALRAEFGNAAGDQVKVNVALLADGVFRSTDCFARMGAAEFAAVLPQTGPAAALKIAQRLRSRVAKAAAPAEITSGHGGAPACTISIGLAVLREGESIPDLLAHAQKALHAAKAAGGNRVECAGA